MMASKSILSSLLLSGAALATANGALIAYYPLDGDFLDTSGNGNDGTMFSSPEEVTASSISTSTTSAFGIKTSAPVTFPLLQVVPAPPHSFQSPHRPS